MIKFFRKGKLIGLGFYSFRQWWYVHTPNISGVYRLNNEVHTLKN